MSVLLSLVILILTFASSSTGFSDDDIEEHQRHLAGIPHLVKSPPVITYVTPGTSVRIECVADPAVFVNFFCNNKIVDRHKLTQKVGNGTALGGYRYSFYVTVSFTDVHQWFGKDDYWCMCEAWNHVPALGSPKKTRSHKAYVKMACK